MKNKKYICPICGYDKLDECPYDIAGEPSFDICPCCGFEYGYDDMNSGFTFEQYREKWIKDGCKWFDREGKPENWELNKQLRNIKSYKRNLENEIIKWWIAYYPECKHNLLDIANDWENDEEIGIYNLLNLGLICHFYEPNFNNKIELEKFLNIYEKFLKEFLPKYQIGKRNDLKDMTGIEMFEWLNKEQLEFVNSLLKPGNLKDICLEYYKFL